jgi:hypothetical protein
MKRALSLCLALTFALTLSGVAFAQQSDDDDRERRTIYRPVTNIDFGEKDIEGVLKGPHIKLLRGDDAPVFDPLMRVRTDFNREILGSVHEL